MKKLIRAAAAAGALCLLAACAGQPEIPYERNATSGVKTIGLLTPVFPEGPLVARASSVGQSFGLIGATIEAGLQSAREGKFKTSIAPQNFMARATFLKDVHEQLSHQGYKVVDIAQTRVDKSLLKQYPGTGATQPVDAYLDLVVGSYGYIAAGVKDDTPYRPTFSMSAKLVNAKDSAVLMQDGIVYNLIGPAKGIITISPDPAFAFTDSDVLIADPKKAVEGMRASIAAASETLGSLLK